MAERRNANRVPYRAFLEDLQKLGNHQVIIKCSGEPMFRSVREEVRSFQSPQPSPTLGGG